MKRIDVPELLDGHDATADDVDRSLRDLRRINRWFGGIAVYRRLVRELAPAPTSVLDLGSGTADLLDALPPGPLRIALDLKIEHLLRVAAASRVRRVVGDAMRLPFRSGAVDIVTSAHFLHHFSPEENVAIARESLRVARTGVAVNDTRRHRIPLLFVQLAGTLRLIGRITRHDAPASVRRGYTIAEVRSIAALSGARRVSVGRFFPYRLGMLLWK